MMRFDRLVCLTGFATAAFALSSSISQAGFWDWKHYHCGPKCAPRGEVAAVVPAVMRSGQAMEVSRDELERALQEVARKKSPEATEADDNVKQRLDKLENNVDKLTDLVTRLTNAVEKLEEGGQKN